MATQEAPPQNPDLVDQLTNILIHPEFLSHMQGLVGHGMELPPEQQQAQDKKQLTPEQEKIIEDYLDKYHQDIINKPLVDPSSSTKPASTGSMLFDKMKSVLKWMDEHPPEVGGASATPEARKAYKKFSEEQQSLRTPVNAPTTTGADELSENEPTELAGKPDEQEVQQLPDQAKDYQSLIDELTKNAGNLSTGVDIANDAADETQKQIFNAYSKVVPIEPITPLRVLGDLVKIGASFATQRNPGLALALSGAGDAIKSYDPAFRDYTARKNFANAIFEGMSATSLKALDAKLREGPEKRTLGTQVKLAAIQEKGQNVRQQYHETSENVRSRQAGERQLESMGLKTGRQSLLDQIAGLTNDAGFVKLEMERLNDESTYDGLSQREKLHVAMQNVINRQHPKENFNATAVKRAEDDLYKMISREIKK